MSLVFKTPKSALNTTSGAIQIKNGDNLQEKSVTYSQEGEFTVVPDPGMYGLSKVDITIDVPSDVHNQTATVDPSTSQQVVEPEEGYTGLSSVTVNAVTSAIDQNIAAGNIKKDVSILGVTGSYDPQPNLSNLNITPSINAQEYNPAISGVDGYSLVRVSAVTSAIDQNITAGNIKDGVTILGVTGSYDPQPELQAKTVNPSTSQQTVTPDQGKDGLSSVTVNAVTASIDSNIQSENILSGVTILGVTGSDEGYDAGYSEGEVAGYGTGYEAGYSAGQAECPTPVFEQLNVTPTTSAQQIYPVSGDGFDEVNVAAVTAAIDQNIVAGNIRNGVTILGVSGSYSPQPNLQSKNATPSTSSQTIQPDNGYDGLSSVSIAAVTAAIDANIVAENILDGVTILGVTGTDLGYDAGYSEGESAGYQSGYDEGYANGQEQCAGGEIQASTDYLALQTNQVKQMSIASGEDWEIEIDEPSALMNTRSLSKSGLRSGEQTLDIDQMSGSAGVYTLSVLSTSDQNTGFTLRGLDSGNEVYVSVSSMADYFTIKSLANNNTITWECYDDTHLLEYSTDEGETWSTTTLTQEFSVYKWTISLNANRTIMFRGNNDAFSNISQQTCRFTSTQNVDVYGNICSLLKSGDFQDYSLNAPYVFTHFFGGGASYIPHLKVVNASNLILPSGVITDNSCASMFDGCEELTSAPQLPARYVGQNGYSRMFAGCTSLTTAPELPATVVQSYGYQQMFSGCTNLVTAPSILYPKYLTWYCYYQMFDGCSSLEASPILPATTLQNYCYYQMFDGCSSLSEVTCLATDISAPDCTTGWLNNVAASGTFYKNEDMTSWTTGVDGIPSGWTVDDYVEE